MTNEPVTSEPIDKVKQDVPLACIKRRGKIAFIPLNASPATEDMFLRYL
jgi:hypothetical protein